MGYLALMPGMLLLQALEVAHEPLVVAVALFSFVTLGPPAAAARAHDRAAATVDWSLV